MKQAVKDFFIDLESLKVEKFNNYIYEDGIRCKSKGPACYFPGDLTIDGVRCFFKYEHLKDLLFGQASSKIYYEHLDIPTPLVSPIQTMWDRNLHLASQDVKVLNRTGIYVSSAGNASGIQDIKLDHLYDEVDNKWDYLYNSHKKEKLLKYMTEECLDELTTIFIIDEIRTDPDRHWENFFLYKNPNSKKYEGVIPIDLEYNILSICSESNIYSNRFENFLQQKYPTFSLYNCREKHSTYPEKLYAIKKLIQDGVLKDSQIERIRTFVNSEFSGLIKRNAHKYNLQNNPSAQIMCELSEQLESYYRKEFENEL